MGLKVLKAGLLTTVQDLGRTGYRKEGIIVSGAMDTLALRIGNLLVGNPENEAALECTLMGPKLQFESDQLIAITGGDLSPAVDGVAVKMWRPLFVKNGAVLSFGAAAQGCRTYLIIHGGLAIDEILESRATYLRAGFGGWEGRALQAGDHLLFRKAYTGAARDFKWSFYLPAFYPDLNDPAIRVITGPEYEQFTEKSKADLFAHDYYLTNEADRMGYRLQGPLLELIRQEEMLSSAVAFGTIQITNNGQPIVLMADHQTTGGYPRIAQVISADFSRLAQLQSGQAIRFRFITLAEAHEAYLLSEQRIKLLKQTLTFKI